MNSPASKTFTLNGARGKLVFAEFVLIVTHLWGVKRHFILYWTSHLIKYAYTKHSIRPEFLTEQINSVDVNCHLCQKIRIECFKK